MNIKHSLPQAIIPIASQVSKRVFRSRWLAERLFHLKLPTFEERDDYYFDVTTVVLVNRATQLLSSSSRVVDMGTGGAAIIGLSLWKRLRCWVLSSDVNPDLVRLAQRSVSYNKANMEVVHSSYFENIDEDFDTVIFNPPYVSTDTGKRRNLSDKRGSQWHGGERGVDVIEGYFAALAQLTRPVTTYLGLNYRHVSRRVMLDLLAKQASLGIDLQGVFRHRLLPVDVYTIANHRQSEINKRAIPSS